MSQNSRFNIDFEFQPDTVRLLPEGPIQVLITPRYHADGVLDSEDLLGQFVAGVEEKMGKLEPISQEGQSYLKTQIVQGVIEQIYRPMSNVLDDFEDDGEPYWDAEGMFHLPLRMLGTGYKLDLVPKLDASGEVDCDALVADLEKPTSECWRR